jgi:hypothetical protein
LERSQHLVFSLIVDVLGVHDLLDLGLLFFCELRGVVRPNELIYDFLCLVTNRMRHSERTDSWKEGVTYLFIAAEVAFWRREESALLSCIHRDGICLRLTMYLGDVGAQARRISLI